MPENVVKVDVTVRGLNEFEKFIQELTYQFMLRINLKTGWGKNEVIVAFKDSIIAATSKSITLIPTPVKPQAPVEDEPDRIIKNSTDDESVPWHE